LFRQTLLSFGLIHLIPFGIMKLENEYNKKDRLMVRHQTINVTAGSLQGGLARLGSNPSERKLKDGLFFMVK